MGQRLRSQRGPIGTTWFATELRELLEAYLGPSRSQAGRRDARAGAVQWVDISPGRVRAQVETPGIGADGSVASPILECAAFSPADHAVAREVASSFPEFAATMAAGNYPEHIDAALTEHGVSLLPRNDTESLSHDCSCEDWPGPCRHVAATVFAFVEEIDQSPAGLLTLRGLTMADLAPASRDKSEHEADAAAIAEATGVAHEGHSWLAPGSVDAQRLRAEDLAPVIGADAARVLTDFFQNPDHSE